MQYLLGLTGKRQSGKDTLASALVAHHNFQRIAFADALKDMLYIQNPWVTTNDDSLIRLVHLVNRAGWDGAKQHDDVRRLLQRAGQWMFKVDRLFWVKAAMTSVDPSRSIVITDVRFDHERDWLANHNGLLVRVERSGHVITDADASETEADAWDYDCRVWNDGPGLSDPRAMAAGLMSWLEG